MASLEELLKRARGDKAALARGMAESDAAKKKKAAKAGLRAGMTAAQPKVQLGAGVEAAMKRRNRMKDMFK